MRVLSLFSGIGGFDLAFTRAGMECVGMCEIDKNCQDVLHKRFPGVPIYDDVKEVGAKQYERGTIDLIAGGFPDDWNDWLSDSVRYRQFGNAVAVPVVEWIGKRIMEAKR